MSWRRLRVLIEHLPPESATWTALRNSLSDEELAKQAEKGEPEKARWSQTEQLLALVADRVADVGFVLRAVNTDKKSTKPRPPEPIRRPGAKPPRLKQQINEAQANTLFKLINGGAA
ncbi:hypothetical protein OG352_06535 [Streptomyces sp. NBC_01485]|uniref:hypothetical protein n=1 Tax=Streptomyces sp. NBC_01485 TaxID=2903884 RepID=UPI002E3248F7|nr:hypothetical protein [Streptomyces sp. NBC_01485]